jgi:TonB family protein
MSADAGLRDKSYRKISPDIWKVQLNAHKSISERPHHSLYSKGNVAVLLIAVLLLPLRFAWADDGGIENQLKSDYANKVLTLRRFYSGEHLRFHSDGTLNGDAPVGPWTLDGQIEVEGVHLHSSRLVIKGRRIHQIFDAQHKPQDELTALSNDHGKPQKDLEKALRRLKVEIEIELPGEKPDEKDVFSAIHAVFLTNSESMMDIVPSYWRAYFAKQEGKPQSAPEPKFKQGGGVSAPHVTYHPDPEYSDEARKVKYQGTVVVSLIVDASGTTRELQIHRPLGLGLDEKAIAAISTWKFEPAQKDGKPVPVAINVEVTFRLWRY